MRRIALLAMVIASVAAVAGCGGKGNKAGANIPTAQTLTFEVPDDGDPPAAVFASRVANGTHGKVHIRHDLASPYTSAVPANELRLVHALENGKVDVGYLPARAWAAAGVPEFKVLLTPFALSTETAAQTFAQSPLATSVLQSLPHSVVGLALVPQEARRILTTTPPTSTAALRGLRIRIVDNPQTAADLRAVGARPVEGLNARQAGALLQAHKLDGVESDAAYILTNGYQSVAHYFSTYSPFPKFQTIVVSRTAWNALTPAEHAALRAAAADTVSSAVASEPFREGQQLTELCQAEGKPVTPTRAHLAQIAAAMRSSTPRSLTEPASKELLAQILRLPGTGVRTFASPLPYNCLHPPKQVPFVHRGGTTIPPGVYTVTDTHEDYLKGHVINPDFVTSITYVTLFRKDGTWYQTQKPNFPDQGPFSGTYAVHGDQVTIVMTRAGAHGQNSISAPETVHWSFFDGKLTLRSLIVTDPASRVLYEAHAWRKIR